jgi:hypothetical protein
MTLAQAATRVPARRRNFRLLTGQPTAREAPAPFEFEKSKTFGKKRSTIKSFYIGTTDKLGYNILAT